GVVGLERYQGCPIPDTDGDGLNDETDKCITQAGTAKYEGCPIPDQDGDGVNDEEDKCIDVAGLPKYAGCPIPDTDGDTINDEEDKCPNEAGVAAYGGCPIPDTDGDGVIDDVDKCPNEAGPQDNAGCPVIGIKSYEIAFKSGSAVLVASSKAVLDTAVSYMNNHPTVNVTIDGYTDSTGSDKVNQPLSQKRADAAKAYMVSKGINEDRMTTRGFGSANPIEDNKTKEGRKMNRRIEIKVQ
ncbi:MAG TPA: OmpA family protein, partial [Agriterribacter sp.]|nr:OmpA family protein [Agriterribacter sp.]